MEELKVKISGMHCASCVAKIEKALSKADGVGYSSVNLANEEAYVKFDPKITDKNKVSKIIKDLGYKIKLSSDKEKDFELILLILSFIFTIPLISQMFFPLHLGHTIEFILATPVQFFIGYRFHKGAISSLRTRTYGMDVLVSMGTNAAYFLSLYLMFKGENNHSHLYFESSASVISFILLGKYLEHRAKKKTTTAIKSLEKLRPEIVLLKNGENIKEINLRDVKLGDELYVKPGTSIPLDGNVISGSSHVDESMLTGESLPIFVKEGSFVTGGTLNQEAPLVLKVTSLKEDTILSKMIRLVEETTAKKTKIQSIVDRVSQVFVPTVFIISLITLFSWLLYGASFEESLIHMVSVLVIACPCALGLALPASIMVGVGVAAKFGVLIRDPDVFEMSEKLTHIAFDKTGTLTKGKPVLFEITELSENIPYGIVKKMQSEGNHPLSLATLNHDKIKGANVVEGGVFKVVPGYGSYLEFNNEEYFLGNMAYLVKNGHEVPASLKRGFTTSFFFSKNKVYSIFYYKDELKEDSKEAVSVLKNLGLKTLMISGDNEEAAKSTAKELGIDEVYANVRPEGKLEIIENLKKNHIVSMVGDGINDALALTASHVGISMGEGTDVAIHSSGITLMRSSPSLVPVALELSRKTFLKIKQNLFWAFVYNVIGIPLAAFGYLNPMLAGMCMSLSSISVLLNSLLLKKFKPKRVF